MSDTDEVVLMCIHGIGAQRPGETADEVARAVALAAEQMDLRFSRFESTSSESALLRFERVDAPPIDLRFEDGWWDDRVATPPAHVTLAWVLRVAPFALWNTAALWALDIRHVQQSRFGDAHPAGLVLPFLAMVVCFLIAPIVLLVGAVLLVLAWPARVVRKRARDVLRRWLGDAWSYRSDLLDESVVAHLQRRVRGAASVGKSVFLVGHSQGAEIGRRVALLENVTGCVWVGSGEAQLSGLRILRRSRWLPPLLFIFAALFPPLFSIAATSGARLITAIFPLAFDPFVYPFGSPVMDPDIGVVARIAFASAGADLMAVAALLGFSVLFSRSARHPSDLLAQPDCPVTVVKSLLDPVCVGPNAGADLVRHVPLGAPRRWHLEHVTYFEKPETGRAILESVFGTEGLPGEAYAPTVPKRVYALAIVAAAASVTGLWCLGHAMLTAVF